MGNYAVEGFATIAQNYITKTLAPQQYLRSAMLYALAGITAGYTNEPLAIGRKDAGEVLSGLKMSPARRMFLQSINSYQPRIQAYKTSNTRMMGARPTMPTVGSATTRSHGQATQAAADFRFAKMRTPILVWHEDIDRALDGNEGRGRAGMGVAVGQLVEEATQVGLQEHMDHLACRLLYGSPPSQDEDPWLDFSGVASGVSASNRYGRINRGALSTGDPWLSNVISTSFQTDITSIVDYCKINLKFNSISGGPYLILAGGANYLTFKNQVLNRGGVIMETPAGAGLPAMAKIGVEREVVKKDDYLLMWEPMLDSCPALDADSGAALYTATPTYVYVLSLREWVFILNKKYNIKTDEFVDISNKSEGAKDADQGFITTRGLLACDKPNVQAVFTALA